MGLDAAIPHEIGVSSCLMLGMPAGFYVFNHQRAYMLALNVRNARVLAAEIPE